MPDTHTPQTLDLHTSRFRAVHDDLKAHYGVATLGYLPVRTSVGVPRFIAGAYDWPYASLLAPLGGVLKIKDRDEYHTAYIARLESIGVDEIVGQLGAISDQWADGRPLLLLCFEDLSMGEWCHRRMFAEWWLTQTGITVPETPPNSFPTRPLQPGHGVLPPSKL